VTVTALIRRKLYICATALALVFGAAILARAQQQPSTSEPRPIQDNSFLIEEAYNQEDGVVQHISALTLLWPGGDWTYTFTQEFPLRTQKHQLSYTMSLMNAGGPPGGAGFGDMAINYRYQLVGSGDTPVAFAPRLSVLAPTGDVRAGRSTGGWGLQTNLPLSVEIGKHFVTHLNAGASVIPHARNGAGERARTSGYNLGQSVIWLARPRFNVMVETLWIGAESVIGPNRTELSHALYVSPGVRWAHNFPSGLQIVPGVAVPIGAGPSKGEKGLILYLSFEHPWNVFKGADRQRD
jgi:hypothetical protein